MSKNLIFTINTNEVNVASESNIPLTTIARRKGCVLDLSSPNLILKEAGYYLVYANITLTGQTAGDVGVAILKNNIAVEGLSITETITTATTETRTISISGIVRVFCSDNKPALLTLYNNGIAITITNANLSAIYLG